MAQNKDSSTKQTYIVGKPQILPASLPPVNLQLLKQLFPQSVLETEVGLRRDDLDLSLLETLFKDSSEVDLLQTLAAVDNTPVLVVEMTPDQVKILQQAYGGRLIVEADAPLELFSTSQDGLPTTGLLKATMSMATTTFEVVVKAADTLKAVSGATVFLVGQVAYNQAVTNKQGRAKLTLSGETHETLRQLIIIPADGYWSLITGAETLEVTVDPLLTEEIFDWGCKALRLDEVTEYRGAGVKIAIIDSGLLGGHEDLKAKQGYDFTDEAVDTDKDWQDDGIGHGTHVAGTVVAHHNRRGIKGFAPEADLYILKVFPGGRISSLIAALKYCVDHQIDIVNLSLGSSTPSQLLHEQILLVKAAGIACIAAAGNSAGPVQYPAAFPEVLAVAAIGKLGTFPADSIHQEMIGGHQHGDFFTASFTCFGPEIDVCAPGVAIISSYAVSSASYKALDGTSMACPHVTGLAALILEKRADIRNLQGAQRVDALFAAIKAGCRDLGFPNIYQGAGLPDAMRTLELETDGGDDQRSWEKLDRLLSQAIEIVRELEVA